ncbi:MAG: hypothetical protein GKR89_07160 [Candidatus Latescibacteria bacterium]|nr:hypothetical protein [Candidatus Latescibacterota bacterium]
MSAKYTAAIVGCGDIGHAHMAGYNLVDEVDVVAVVDPNEQARNQYAAEYGIGQSYATVEEMLQTPPDIVSVCTWHPLHPECTIAAARAGVKAVICEKPMAIGLGLADSMVEACAESGTKLVISHQRRFTLGWEKARELVAAGAIGQVLRVDSKIAQGLANCGTHAIDGIRFILGDPPAAWVMGAVERDTDRYERDTAIEDSCMGLIHMQDGLQVFIQADMDLNGASPGIFALRGTEGMIDVGETYTRLFNGDTGGWQECDLGVSKDQIHVIGGQANGRQTRELLRWLEGGPEHRGAGSRARDTVELMMALYESARQHRIVHLPLQEKDYPLQLMIDQGRLPVQKEGRYDIRGFLKRDDIDEAAYERLRAQGMGHHPIMRKLHEERSKGG